MPMMSTRLKPVIGDAWRLSPQNRYTIGDFRGKLGANKACAEGSLHD